MSCLNHSTKDFNQPSKAGTSTSRTSSSPSGTITSSTSSSPLPILSTLAPSLLSTSCHWLLLPHPLLLHVCKKSVQCLRPLLGHHLHLSTPDVSPSDDDDNNRTCLPTPRTKNNKESSGVVKCALDYSSYLHPEMVLDKNFQFKFILLI